MRTKNFFKGLAVAAVALVGVFATSCSEEELNLNGTITGSPVDPVTPTELPDGVAYAAISVVDLGDLGLGSKVLYTGIKDVTGLDGTEIECPDFDGMEEYVIPAAQKISVPTLQKGQSVTIPMTFYVVKTESAFAQVEWDIDDAKDWGWTEEGTPYVYSEETWKGTEEEDLQNLSNYWKDIQVRYSVPYAYFVEVLGETEAPEGGEGEGTEGEEGEGTEGEGGEGEGTEGEEGGEGEGEATEGTSICAMDFTTAESYPYYRLEAPEGSSYDVADGALVITNEVEQDQNYLLQPFVADWFSVQEGYNYTVAITMKASADGKANIVMGTWSASMETGLDFTASEEYTTYKVEFTGANFASDADDVHVLFQCGKFVGTIEIAKVEVIETAPATARVAATTAEEIVAAYVKNIVMPEYGVEGDSYTQIAGPVTLFSGGCVDFTKTIYSTKPTYVFTYMGEEVEVTFEQIMYAFGVLGTPYAIPGHETEYSHSEGHGHYQHDQHGNDMNAGGGIVSFE